MISRAAFALMLLQPLSGHAADPSDSFDVEGEAEVIVDLNRKIDGGDLAPAEVERLRQERDRRVDRIAQAGDRKPDDLRRQNEVARALATVNEGERAVPYAERTVELAEKTGKPRNIATALTTSALAYQAAGRFEEAYRRAARAVEVEPGNREAMSVYQSLRGRGNPVEGVDSALDLAPKVPGKSQSAQTQKILFTPLAKKVRQPPPLNLAPEAKARSETDSTLGDAQRYYSPLCMSGDGYACDAREISQNCFGSDNSNQCVRVCLVSIDAECQYPRWLSKSACRAGAHVRCYAKCGKIIPTIYEHSCYSRIWRGFGVKPDR